MAGKIFINYRRKLNLMEARLLKKVLERHFGAGRVFLDESGLEAGKHWPHMLEAQVDAAAAMVSLIPKGWANVRDETGSRRLDNPDDFVRFEIARAFTKHIPLLPLTLDGAAMPSAAELPPNLALLAYQQAMRLRSESFDDDGGKIAAQLKKLIAPRRAVPYWAAGAIAASALALGLAGGHPVLTALGVIRPSTDAALHAAQKAAEAKYANAADELSRARAELKAVKEALSAAREKGEAAAARVTELTGRLQNALQALKEAKAAAQKAQADLKAANERADRAETALKQHTPNRREDSPTLAAATAPEAGESFKDCAVCPEMVVVPAGSFNMGSLKSEPGHQDDESPLHRVEISKPFAVGRFAVTFAEWDACVNDGGCGGSSYIPDDEGWGRGERPVINVSWNDAKSYVKWLSGKTGKEYRLLSEAEWEYAARAGTKTPFWWGKTITTDQANYDGNYPYNGGAKGEYRGKTVPVRSFAPNPWGLYQVHGNVWEWVEDCYQSNYNGAPSDGSPWRAASCSERVLRGGSWSGIARYARAAYRSAFDPGDRSRYFGFRVCASSGLSSSR